MPYSLHTIKPGRKSKHSSRRFGRGYGSGRGKTAGRGTKGQKARSGGRGGLKRLGMKTILLQQPKLRGFKSLKTKCATVNIGDIIKRFDVGALITPKALVNEGLVTNTRNGVKILGRGECTKKMTFKNVFVSVGALKKIESAGGSVVVPVKHKQTTRVSKKSLKKK